MIQIKYLKSLGILKSLVAGSQGIVAVMALILTLAVMTESCSNHYT